jgi:hypothetical protein
MPRRAAPAVRERASQASLAAGKAGSSRGAPSRPDDDDDDDQATVHMRNVTYASFEEDECATVVVKAEDFLYDDRSLNE